MLGYAPAKQRNIIVRPHGASVTFIQLDDLKADRLPALAPRLFLALETSPGNYQAWLALSGNEDKDFARRLRKGAGADPTASGATRVAGSLNFKDKYALSLPRPHQAQRWPSRPKLDPNSRLGDERVNAFSPQREADHNRIWPRRRHPKGRNRTRRTNGTGTRVSLGQRLGGLCRSLSRGAPEPSRRVPGSALLRSDTSRVKKATVDAELTVSDAQPLSALSRVRLEARRASRRARQRPLRRPRFVRRALDRGCACTGSLPFGTANAVGQDLG